MSKKINAQILPTLKEKINEVKTITVDINGEDFEININTFLSLKLKEELMKNLQINATDNNIDVYGGEFIAFYAIIQTLTDIDLTEDMAESVELFTALLDLGIIGKIVEVIPEQTYNEINDSLMLLESLLKQMSETDEVS